MEIVEKGLGLLFITPSSSHFFNETDFEQYLSTITKNTCIKFNSLWQGSATFKTSGPHSVLTRFQRTKREKSLPEIQAFFGRFDGEDQQKKGLCQNLSPFFGQIDGEEQKKGENHFGGLLVHIYHWKKEKGCRPHDNKSRGPGKMP